VGTAPTSSDFEIAPGYRVSDWEKLNLGDPESGDWARAVEILKQRIEKRFFDPVDVLIEADKNNDRRAFGFAVLAIDFLVVETLQGFREGVVNHRNGSKRLFKSFIQNWAAFRECAKGKDEEKLAESIYERGRCALHHSGATGGALIIGVSGPVFEFSGSNIRINRNKFHEKLKLEFSNYLRDLSAAVDSESRRNFVEKMKAICRLGAEETL
jgi:hypothetical protein